MKKLMYATLLAVLTLCLIGAMGGCSKVVMTAEYSELLDKTAAVSLETAARATAGELTPAEMTEALVKQSIVWMRFQNARDGKE